MEREHLTLSQISDRMRWEPPEARVGRHAIQRFTISGDEAARFNLASAFSGSYRGVKPGQYTRLVRFRDTRSTGLSVVVMSDTPAEIRDHAMFLYAIHRRVEPHDGPTVLIHGLGLGCAALGALAAGAKSVDVVEISEEVRDLTEAALREEIAARGFDPDVLTVRIEDARTWRPERGARWDVVWHDIWDDICGDNLDEMKTFHRRFGRRSDWQGSWARELAERN